MHRRDEYPESLLRRILEHLTRLTEEIQKMSTNPPVTQAQFTADLAALQTALGNMITNVQSDIAALKAQIAAGQPADFSALDATVQSMSTAVTAENTAVEADQAPPPPPPAA